MLRVLIEFPETKDSLFESPVELSSSLLLVFILLIFLKGTSLNLSFILLFFLINSLNY